MSLKNQYTFLLLREENFCAICAFRCKLAALSSHFFDSFQSPSFQFSVFFLLSFYCCMAAKLDDSSGNDEWGQNQIVTAFRMSECDTKKKATFPL